MIRKVVLRRFKRFDEVEFRLPGHVVLAGPNNTGKTTLLQAIASWDLALRRWREHNDFLKHRGAYTKVPISRPAFTAVPLGSFDLLWSQRQMRAPIEITVQSERGWTLTMEILPDTVEQVLVRPRADVERAVARDERLQTVFVPPMTGLTTEEPLYAKREFLDLRLAQARPGEVLRNVLVEASDSSTAWTAIEEAVGRLFGYRLLPPDPRGAHILAEYEPLNGGPRLDIASAGSGFQQILMLLTFLHTRPESVLLLDEPDAHLHVLLQDAIYGELRRVAARKGSQLVIATHSEVVIDSVEPDELCLTLGRPRLLADHSERERLRRSLGVLSNTDIMLAEAAPGVLYVEDWTDLEILRAFAIVSAHRVRDLLTSNLLWRPWSKEARTGGRGVTAERHFDALRLVRADLPGLALLDRDANPRLPETDRTQAGLQRVRWRRYEIESYLVHPAALARFVENQVGSSQAEEAKRGLHARLREFFEELTDGFLADPLRPSRIVESFFETTKARTDILPALLDAAGLHGFQYTRYHEIAAVMRPEEVHPEVIEKLDAIAQAFRL